MEKPSQHPPPILRSLPDQLVGARVIVRPFQPGDGEAIWEAVEETRAQLSCWFPWVEKHKSWEDSEAFARRSQAKWLLRDALPLGIWERETGQYLGSSGFVRVNWDVPRFEIGYWLRTSAQGQGYMTEAVSLHCRFAFDMLRANRVEIRCDVRNDASAAIPRRLGFIQEACVRNESRDHWGKLRDMLLFALTPTDYQQSLEKGFL